MTSTRRRMTIGVGAALTLLVSACGSDKSTTTTPAASATPATTVAASTAPAVTTGGASTASTSAGGAAAFDPAKYCSAELNLEKAAAQIGNSDAAPKDIAAQLLAAVEPSAALAPAELQASFNGAIETLKSVVSSGDGEALQNLSTPPDVHAFDLKSCGWQRTDVDAADYHFTGMPATLAAGVHDIELTNSGKEFHVLVIVRKKAGVTESFDELLNDPEAEGKTEDVLGAAAAPGAPASYGVADLQPGEYLVLCPVSTGSTGQTEGTGPPHFTLGMHQLLTVT